MFLRFKFFILFAFAALVGASVIGAQQAAEKPSKKERQEAKQKAADAAKNVTAEQVAESAIVIYGGLGGRASLNQIRKTSLERGRISIVNAEGKTEQANYERWVMRAETLDKERIRFEQEFPSAKYALVYTGEKIFGLYNDAVFTPREDASKAFENQIRHGLEALLRYKENASTVALDGRDKLLGVDFYRLDVADKQIEETQVQTITFGQKVEEGIFQAS